MNGISRDGSVGDEVDPATSPCALIARAALALIQLTQQLSAPRSVKVYSAPLARRVTGLNAGVATITKNIAVQTTSARRLRMESRIMPPPAAARGNIRTTRFLRRLTRGDRSAFRI